MVRGNNYDALMCHQLTNARQINDGKEENTEIVRGGYPYIL